MLLSCVHIMFTWNHRVYKIMLCFSISYTKEKALPSLHLLYKKLEDYCYKKFDL